MPTNRNGRRAELSMQALSQREIDEWIHQVVLEVAAGDCRESEPSAACGGARRPRWIPAGELVRRMNRFLCPN